MDVLDRHRWLPFVLPFLVYVAAGYFEPRPAPEVVNAVEQHTTDRGDATPAESAWAVSYRAYPWFYAARIAVTLGVALLFMPVYRGFALRIRVLSLAVGVLGAAVWIGLAQRGWEAALLQPLGIGGWLSSGTRAAFDPITALGDTPLMLAAFLGVRFFGLVCLVPLIEEFFLRGFLMRYVVDPDWWTVAVGRVTPLAVAMGTLYGVLAHPGEALAAAVWFSLISWLVCKTRNIWDAIAAHAVTNLLLGIYIVARGQWGLW